MTREEFEALRNRIKTSGGTLKSFLKTEGIAYSTYNLLVKEERSRNPTPWLPSPSGNCRGSMQKYGISDNSHKLSLMYL
ncbi:MAG: hypothetical protein J1F07_09395 [Muribaculaceae bacterium]|nr:hypothetical protein [Muribaculaceae bacterium]